MIIPGEEIDRGYIPLDTLFYCLRLAEMKGKKKKKQLSCCLCPQPGSSYLEMHLCHQKHLFLVEISYLSNIGFKRNMLYGHILHVIKSCQALFSRASSPVN